MGKEGLVKLVQKAIMGCSMPLWCERNSVELRVVSYIVSSIVLWLQILSEDFSTNAYSVTAKYCLR